MAKRVTLTKKDGEKVYPRTYTKLVQNGDGEILDNIMLTSAKILPFSGYEVGLNDASLEAVAPSGYTINYNRSRNRFFAVVRSVNYSNWGNAEQLLYNGVNNAREDNVYIHSNGNICVIQNGSMTTISTVGTQLVTAEEALQRDLEAEVERATQEEGRIEANLNAESIRAIKAEGVLRDNLDAEVTRATAAEGALLSANKFLQFSAVNGDLNITLQMASTTRSGEPIFYIQKHNVFAIRKNGLYYPAWRTSANPTESLKYNNGNGTVGYTAREDNVYMSELYNMYVIIDGTVTLVTNIGTAVSEAFSYLESKLAKVKADIDAFLLDADASSAAIDTLKEIQSYIDSDKESAAAMIASIQANATAITAETERATTAEGVLRDNLDAEVTRATAAEGALLSANKFLQFSAFNVYFDVTLQTESTTRSGEPILYIQKHNVFAIEKNGLYYPSWGTESLKYNNGNGAVGYTAREDNVYIAKNDMYVITDGIITLVANGGGAYPIVNHGTSDTDFILTPNTFHVWGEVASLSLTLGAEENGVANEYLFQFDSGDTATTLTLPDKIKWANDAFPVIEANKTYQISIIMGYGRVLVYPTKINTNNYLTIVALEDGLTASLSSNDCEYCVGDYGNWKALSAGTPTESVNAGQKLLFRAKLTPNTSSGIGTFTISKRCTLAGNCMSMLFGDNAADNLSLEGKGHAFYRLFYNCTSIINVSNDFLLATTLSNDCYAYMFYGCTSLVNAPELPATTLSQGCYAYMFRDCSSLVNAPELPATTLSINCYLGMFYGCTSLVTAPELHTITLSQGCYFYMFRDCSSLVNAPELPATTLSQGCYRSMFYGCTSLVNAPELPATTLSNDCYSYMFSNCTSLNFIKMLATDISAMNCLYNWVNGVASSGTFVKSSAMTSLPTGASGIPSGWTVENV